MIESIDQLTNLMEEGNSAGLTELAAVVKSSQISLLSTLNIFPGSDVGRTPTMDPLKDCNSFFQTHNISQGLFCFVSFGMFTIFTLKICKTNFH